MKATLSAEGKLKIEAQDELESYALKQWWKNYNPEGEGESVLQVETTVVTGIAMSDVKARPDPFQPHTPFGPIARGYGNPVIPGESVFTQEFDATPKVRDLDIKRLAAEGLSQGEVDAG